VCSHICLCVIKFFMTNQSLFVLLVDITTLNLSNFRGWLNSIRFRTNQHQSTIIVANKCSASNITAALANERLEQIRECIRQAKCSSWIRGDVIQADFKTNQGTDALRNRMLEAVPSIVSSWNQQQPLRWVRLEEIFMSANATYRLYSNSADNLSLSSTSTTSSSNPSLQGKAARQSGYLHMNQVRKIAMRQCGIAIGDLPAAITMFNAIGSVIHFAQTTPPSPLTSVQHSPIDAPLLSDFVFCSPQWLVDAIACLINLPPTFQCMQATTTKRATKRARNDTEL
jgi:hypothetical protein